MFRYISFHLLTEASQKTPQRNPKGNLRLTRRKLQVWTGTTSLIHCHSPSFGFIFSWQQTDLHIWHNFFLSFTLPFAFSAASCCFLFASLSKINFLKSSAKDERKMFAWSIFTLELSSAATYELFKIDFIFSWRPFYQLKPTQLWTHSNRFNGSALNVKNYL